MHVALTRHAQALLHVLSALMLLIATILPAKPDYVVTTSEFDDIKSRLSRLENKRKINDKNGGNKPTLRRAGGTNNDPNSNNPSRSGDDRPTLGRRN